MLRRTFAFGRRGRSKKNLVAILKSINDTCLGGVAWRHLDFYSITGRQTNKGLAHFARDMSKNEMFVRECNAKHGSGKDRPNRALKFDGFFRIH